MTIRAFESRSVSGQPVIPSNICPTLSKLSQILSSGASARRWYLSGPTPLVPADRRLLPGSAAPAQPDSPRPKSSVLIPSLLDSLFVSSPLRSLRCLFELSLHFEPQSGFRGQSCLRGSTSEPKISGKVKFVSNKTSWLRQRSLVRILR